MGSPRQIVTLRMGRIPRQHHQKCVLIPETDRLHLGVDQAFGLGTQQWIPAGRITRRTHLTIGPKNASTGCHLMDIRFSQPQVRCHHGALECLARGRAYPLEGLFDKIRVQEHPSQAPLLQQSLGTQVTAWGVVLMQGMDTDPIWRGSHRQSQGFLPAPMSLIADTNPIHRTEKDGFPSSGEHHPSCRQWHPDSIASIVCQGGSDGRGDVNMEACHLKRRLLAMKTQEPHPQNPYLQARVPHPRGQKTLRKGSQDRQNSGSTGFEEVWHHGSP